MRILMIETGGWGGICHYTYNLCTSLSDIGTEIALATAQPYELQNHPHNFSVNTPIVATASYIQNLRAIYKIYNKLKPDIVHIQSTLSARKDWINFLLAKAIGIPIVFTAHNILPHDDAEKNATGMQFAYQQIYRFAQHTIVHSEDSRQTLNKIFKPAPTKVSVIPHGNYVFAGGQNPLSQTEARQKLDLPQEGLLLLAFGTIRPYKGTEDLITAFAKIANQNPNSYLVIAGKPLGTDPNNIKHLIDQHHLSKRIIFRPDYIPMEHIAPYFIASDIAVFPYHAIYQSGALQLAYAFSRPVIATDVGAFPETIDQNKNGLIVPAQDTPKLSEAISMMLNKSSEERTQMGTHSRHLADTRYAWPAVAKQTQAIYHQLLNAH